jgi:hypothetical protein
VGTVELSAINHCVQAMRCGRGRSSISSDRLTVMPLGSDDDAGRRVTRSCVTRPSARRDRAQLLSSTFAQPI